MTTEHPRIGPPVVGDSLGARLSTEQKPVANPLMARVNNDVVGFCDSNFVLSRRRLRGAVRNDSGERDASASRYVVIP